MMSPHLLFLQGHFCFEKLGFFEEEIIEKFRQCSSDCLLELNQFLMIQTQHFPESHNLFLIAGYIRFIYDDMMNAK